MAWGWREPGRNGRVSGGYATQADAEINAIFNACGKRVEDAGLRAPLLRSLRAAGWRIGWEAGDA